VSNLSLNHPVYQKYTEKCATLTLSSGKTVSLTNQSLYTVGKHFSLAIY